MNYQATCSAHGGRSPQALAAAATREAESAAAAELALYGDVAPVADALSALAELSGEAMAWKRSTAARAVRLGGLDATSEQAQAAMAAHERAFDRAARILARHAALNIDGRLLELSAGQRAEVEYLVFNVIRAVLGRHGLDVADDGIRADVHAEMLAALRLFAGYRERTRRSA